MNNIFSLIKYLDLNYNQSILLYSGDYNYNTINNFIPNSNFIWLTEIDIPNFYLYITNKIIYYYYDYSDKWIDHGSVKKLISTLDINMISYEQLKKNMLKKNIIYALNVSDEFILKYKNVNYYTINNYCFKKRIIKSKKEIENIKNAVKVTEKAIFYTIKKLKKNKYSYHKDIVIDFKYYLNKNNINSLSFKPICTSGYSNSIIHSNNYDRLINYDSLLLLDVGCKYNFYSSDVTRCFPLSGKFNKEQRALYQSVLRINLDCIDLCCKGLSFDILEQKCLEFLYIELLKLKFIYPIKNLVIRNSIVRLFMPHSIGHCIGIDTHDPLNNELLNNMVITIEPGIYIPNNTYNPYINETVVKKFKAIGGVRIEDIILINDDKPHILTNFTKNIDEIEKLML